VRYPRRNVPRIRVRRLVRHSPEQRRRGDDGSLARSRKRSVRCMRWFDNPSNVAPTSEENRPLRRLVLGFPASLPIPLFIVFAGIFAVMVHVMMRSVKGTAIGDLLLWSADTL